MIGNTDSGLVYQRTEAGEALLRAGANALTQVARRLLPLFDGRRRVADLPSNMRAGDLEAAITELQTQGLIRFTGRADLGPPEGRASLEAERVILAELKVELDGLFAREMGEPGKVWDARVQDCVNLLILRRVLREAIDIAYFRSGADAARRIVAVVRPIFRAHKPA
jgi:hypothetical protein